LILNNVYKLSDKIIYLGLVQETFWGCFFSVFTLFIFLKKGLVDLHMPLCYINVNDANYEDIKIDMTLHKIVIHLPWYFPGMTSDGIATYLRKDQMAPNFVCLCILIALNDFYNEYHVFFLKKRVFHWSKHTFLFCWSKKEFPQLQFASTFFMINCELVQNDSIEYILYNRNNCLENIIWLS
jgi:hypothetical protein